MSTPRDPLKNPARGDVCAKNGSTRIVKEVKTNQRGTITHVVYDYNNPELPPVTATISSWRGWTKDDCKVLGRMAWQA